MTLSTDWCAYCCSLGAVPSDTEEGRAALADLQRGYPTGGQKTYPTEGSKDTHRGAARNAQRNAGS